MTAHSTATWAGERYLIERMISGRVALIRISATVRTL